MAHISVVIPVYRAEACLEELYRRLVAALEPITRISKSCWSRTAAATARGADHRELARRDPRVKGIQFSRNFGQHYGITAGLDHCDGDWVVVMDCDLQDRPEEIPRLYAKARRAMRSWWRARGKRRDPLFKRLLVVALLPASSAGSPTRTTTRRPATSASCRARSSTNYRDMREQLAFLRRPDQLDGFPGGQHRRAARRALRRAVELHLQSSGSSAPKPSSPIPTSRCGWRCASGS